MRNGSPSVWSDVGIERRGSVHAIRNLLEEVPEVRDLARSKPVRDLMESVPGGWCIWSLLPKSCRTASNGTAAGSRMRPDQEHAFEIEPSGEGRLRFIHSERFGGVLVPLFRRMLDDNTRRGFERMNAALKARAEGA